MQRHLRGKSSWRHGLWAEWAAALLLRLKGYRILHHRLRLPMGEIDLIAHKENLLVFAEVKYRTGKADPLHALTVPQQKRLIQAAQYFARRFPPNYALRFDVILVKPWSFPVHIKNAWHAKG